MKKLKFGVIGYTGKLGKEVVNLFEEKGCKLVLKVNSKKTEQLEKPDVIIECGLSNTVDQSIKLAEKLLVPIVVATTGLSPDQIKGLRHLSKYVPVILSSNYSYGIQVLLKLVEESSKKLKDWDVEISEVHHRFKKDIPSGTAKMIKEKVKREDVQVNSSRIGNVQGEHTIKYGGLGEVLSISHRATSRKTFAEGILKSVNYILKKKKGLFSFKDVVENKQ
ncbi:MAG: 4-hydroxy-tetrahydrodipicolinate reductase [Ignavibacteriales bacterium CG12_big_fil_rev_8_21_14_0_65_30_8]|nr:MAG: 4-hydroxy-tetrahydrodipicolinate reductase [Ignavibacteriales bacterium CG12_big_fil_rev_8_21_14_0_65_30_8]